MLDVVRCLNGGPTRIQYEPPKTHFTDTIGISLTPRKVGPGKVAHLYLSEGLSTRQVAQKLDISKAVVLHRLHSLGIGKGQNPELEARIKARQCPSQAPYGLRRADGQLVPCQREIKVCRIIVGFINNEKLSFRKVGRELERRGIKNRRGEASWHHTVVSAIYLRWSEKLTP